MAKTTTESVRREIEAERQKLADAVDDLRGAADVTAIVREKLPTIAAGAAGAGFFLAGGVGATMRLLARRGREGRKVAKAGRFSLVDRG
ncbi:MAG TPA: DUF3618 domain-containing protein [Gaiellaceae bacterium]|nr:DUF3618 domain-containing protein [Gaiellaceae bacterium]